MDPVIALMMVDIHTCDTVINASLQNDIQYQKYYRLTE